MSWILELFRSTVFKKAVMAITGVMLVGFVVGHMVGNLKLYQGTYESGPHAGEYSIDVYAEGLRELGAPIFGHGQVLWIARVGLLAAVVLHILSAYQVTVASRRARRDRYAKRIDSQAASYASLTMRWGGLVILMFVIYHLLHLTVGNLHSDFVPGEVHRNVVVGFSNPLVSGFYIVANLALGFHLYHGVWSMFQSLGISGPRFDLFRRQLAIGLAVVVSAVNVSFPLAVLGGLVSQGG